MATSDRRDGNNYPQNNPGTNKRPWWDRWLLIPLLFMVVVFGSGLGFFILRNPAIIVVGVVLLLAFFGLERLLNEYFESRRPATPDEIRRALGTKDKDDRLSEK